MRQFVFYALRTLLLSAFASFLLLPNGYAQPSKHGNIWHFGYRAGLDFSGGAPIALNNVNIDAYEGCAVYCDAKGQLLFYTNGGGEAGAANGFIWNRNQQVMYNMGQNKGGGYSSPQSALILPKPGSDHLYYAFTMDHKENLDASTNRGLSYFTVDMNANGGLGAVTEADVRVYREAAECLTAIPKTPGNNFWLVTVDSNRYNFVVIPVDPTGLGVPKIYPRQSTTEVSVLKAAPDGRFLCADGGLYRFDPTTGQPTFLAQLALNGYTFSFSPASRYLYGFDPELLGLDGAVIRYDLMASDVAASRQIVAPGITFSLGGLMQLGPDGNIYFNEQSGDDFADLKYSVSVIKCPDAALPTVTRSLFKFTIPPSNLVGSITTLPNFADYIFARSDTGTVTVSIESPVIKDTCQAFPLTLRTLVSGPGVLQWSNGSKADTLVVKDYGVYSVTLTTACGIASDTFALLEPQRDCCQLLKPNAFTPNNDQVNDTFAPIFENCDVEIFELNIYSRWGELIYQGFRPGEHWDGITLNGTEAVADVYVYTLRYKLAGAEEKTDSGEVTLLR